MSSCDLLIVGNPEFWHIGGFFVEAAYELGILHTIVDVRPAYGGNQILHRFWWHFSGHRPYRLANFNKDLIEKVKITRPRLLLATGLCPISAATLRDIGQMGVQRLVFLCDDPFSQIHRSAWFFKALPFYDTVFNPRKSNMQELLDHGCANVKWLPFGFSPHLHFPQGFETKEDKKRFSCDVALIASADEQRALIARALIQTKLNVRIYGGNWDRFFPKSGIQFGGMVFGSDFRKAVNGARVHICPVRHCNRDGHVMRTFELPACGACAIMEDTEEHRELFGNEGTVVYYYKSPEEAVDKASFLIANSSKAAQIRHAAFEWASSGGHTYQDRLITIFKNSS